MAQELRPIIPVVMAGGLGTRLWPATSSQCPKPLLPLPGGKPQHLLAAALELAEALASKTAPIIAVTDAGTVDVLQRALSFSYSPRMQFVVEPQPLGTAGVIQLAAQTVRERYGEAILWVLPSDHVMDIASVASMTADATQLADAGHMVVCGVEPCRVDTGYGYIRAHGQHVLGFEEKPTAARAEELLSLPEVYWNSGMFVMRADRVDAWIDAYALPRIDETSPSWDRAVVERLPAEILRVLPLRGAWAELGTWPRLWEWALARGLADHNGNVAIGTASDAVPTTMRDCLVYSCSGNPPPEGARTDKVLVETPQGWMEAPHAELAQGTPLREAFKLLIDQYS